MKIRPIAQFLLIAGIVGLLVPYFVSLCLFGTTLQTFVLGAQPTQGYWSGAATAAPTQAPSPVQVWTGTALSSGGGAIFVLWSVLGALAGEGIAAWRWGKDWGATRKAWLGALAGSFIFIAITLCGLLR
jgi:hypothetical protein